MKKKDLIEREFGVQVRYATYESNQEMLAQVMSGNSGWDIVFPSADFVGPMRELGLAMAYVSLPVPCALLCAISGHTPMQSSWSARVKPVAVSSVTRPVRARSSFVSTL